MRIQTKKTLRTFWERHTNAEKALSGWYREVLKENWDSPAKVRKRFPSASIVGGNRVVINIKGNHYRLVAKKVIRRALSTYASSVPTPNTKPWIDAEYGTDPEE